MKSNDPWRWTDTDEESYQLFLRRWMMSWAQFGNALTSDQKAQVLNYLREEVEEAETLRSQAGYSKTNFHPDVEKILALRKKLQGTEKGQEYETPEEQVLTESSSLSTYNPPPPYQP